MIDLVATGARVLAVLAEPFTEVTSRTWWPFLLVAAASAVGVHVWRSLPTDRRGFLARVRDGLGVPSWRSRSAVLDVQLLVVRQLLALLGVLPRLGTAWAVATFLVRTLDRAFGRPDLAAPPGPVLAVAYTLVLFVVWDLSRYVLHRALHASPLLWQFHQVHHSAEVLTPLTFHRVHPVEAILYEARGVLVTGVLAAAAFWLWRGEAVAVTVLGVDAVGFVLSGLTGNLRHSHVWIGFGPRVERWLLSPAQHQLHHGADRRDNGSNYGVWLACWDRLAGSLRLAGRVPPPVFGLAPGVANHDQDLGSALLGPLTGAAARLGRARRSVGPAAVLLGLIVAPRAGSAQEADTDATEDEPPSPAPGEGEEIVVSGSRRAPAVGGAAHEVDQETLERYEHDDIQRVLARVPGVYVRGEDGFGLRPNIGMRGANSDRSAKITLLEDGVPLSPAPYAAPAAYYFPLTTRLVGVEVFKGPSAIAYGPQTIGGAVNLLTRRVPTELDGELDVAAGAWSTLKAHGWGGVGGPRAGVLLEASHLSSGGFKELDGGGPTGFERQDLLAKGRLTFDGAIRHDLELKLGYGRERSDETYLGLSLEDFEATPYRRYAASQQDQMSWQHTQESLSWSLAAADRLVVRTVAYHSWFDRSWTKLNRFAGGPSIHDLLLNADAGQAATYAAILRGDEDSVTADQGLLVGTNARTYDNYGVQSVARLWAGGGQVSNLAELGIRLHADQVARLHTEDPRLMWSGVLVPSGGDTSVTLDSRTAAQAVSGWLRDDLEVGPLHVVPGVRLEHVRTTSADSVDGATEPVSRTHVLPGMALSVEPTHWLMAFTGVHRGFSPVPPGEPADVPAETAWNVELGARLFPGQTYVEVVGFGSAYQNLYGQCTLSSGCADDQVDSQFSGGEALVGGVESILSHELLLPRDISLRGNATYTYTWSAFQTGFVSGFPQWGTVQEGDRLPYVPEHQGAFELLFTMPRVSLGMTSTLRGAMRDVAGQGDIPREELLPTALVFDVAADVRVTDQVTAYLVARNVTDTVTLESLRPFGARPGAPRTVLVGVKVAPRRP